MLNLSGFVVLGDDHPVLDRPQVGVAFPAVEGLAVEQLDRLGLALAGLDDRRSLGGLAFLF